MAMLVTRGWQVPAGGGSVVYFRDRRISERTGWPTEQLKDRHCERRDSRADGGLAVWREPRVVRPRYRGARRLGLGERARLGGTDPQHHRRNASSYAEDAEVLRAHDWIAGDDVGGPERTTKRIPEPFGEGRVVIERLRGLGGIDKYRGLARGPGCNGLCFGDPRDGRE